MITIFISIMTAAVLDLNTIDKATSPADDFYHYAVGSWVKRTKIPSDKPMWCFFIEQAEKTDQILHKILLNAGKATDPNSETCKAGTLFALGMDEGQIEKDGLAPLEGKLKEIERLKEIKELPRVLAHLHLCGSGPFFAFGSMHDPGNSTWMIASLWQDGLSLPDRDYYLEKNSHKIREKYLTHMQKVFRLLGEEKALAAKHATTVLSIETELAQSSMPKEDLRDPCKTRHKMSLRQLRRLTPAFNWKSYCSALELSPPSVLNVGQPDFFRGLDQVLIRYSLEDIKTYLRWHLISALSPCLSHDFVEADFSFFKKTFLGLQESPPRWKRMVGLTNALLGEAVGKIYVREHFPPASKKKMQELTQNIIAAARQRIRGLDWMEKATKKEALRKLDRLTVKVGYPDKWIDYSRLKIRKDAFMANVLRANCFQMQRELREIGKPADRKKWHMSPQTVNAYFSPPNNEIVFPAAILQPIMFNPRADDAVNYGAIGAVIAHEITHDFDDQGRKYDSRGNLRDWWTKNDDKRFRQRSQRLIEQYSGYIAIDDLHVNGKLTLGENIADLGGLNIAYTALQNSLRGKKRKKTDGLSEEQRFFFSWAEGWKTKIRPEYLRLIVKTNPHPPHVFRVNGPLANMPEFARAFNLPQNCPMSLPASKRTRIW